MWGARQLSLDVLSWLTTCSLRRKQIMKAMDLEWHPNLRGFYYSVKIFIFFSIYFGEVHLIYEYKTLLIFFGFFEKINILLIWMKTSFESWILWQSILKIFWTFVIRLVKVQSFWCHKKNRITSYHIISHHITLYHAYQ